MNRSISGKFVSFPITKVIFSLSKIRWGKHIKTNAHSVEMDLAVNSKEEMGKCKEKNVSNVFCVNVNTVQTVDPSRVLLNYSIASSLCLWSMKRWIMEQSGLNCTTGTHPAYSPALPNDGNAYHFRKVMLPSFMFFETL